MVALVLMARVVEVVAEALQFLKSYLIQLLQDSLVGVKIFGALITLSKVVMVDEVEMVM
jgi:hypothetical protein